MSTLLEKTLEIAFFAEKRDVIRRTAREALEEDQRGDTLPLNDLL
jgi:hypothetical protein